MNNDHVQITAIPSNSPQTHSPKRNGKRVTRLILSIGFCYSLLFLLGGCGKAEAPVQATDTVTNAAPSPLPPQNISPQSAQAPFVPTYPSLTPSSPLPLATVTPSPIPSNTPSTTPGAYPSGASAIGQSGHIKTYLTDEHFNEACNRMFNDQFTTHAYLDNMKSPQVFAWRCWSLFQDVGIDVLDYCQYKFGKAQVIKAAYDNQSNAYSWFCEYVK